MTISFQKNFLRRDLAEVQALAACGLMALMTFSLKAREPVEPEGYASQIEIVPLLKTSTTSSGAPIKYPQTDSPLVTVLKVTIPPGAETGWHQHPNACYAYLLSGTLTVDIKDHPPKTFRAGEALVEVVDTTHNGINPGPEPAEIILFCTGEVGKPVSVKVPAVSDSANKAGE